MYFFFFFFQAEDGIRDTSVTGVQTCALPILPARLHEPGNQALGAEFTQRDAGKLVLAVGRARTAGQFAAVANPRRRRIARHLGAPQPRRPPPLPPPGPAAAPPPHPRAPPPR